MGKAFLAVGVIACVASCSGGPRAPVAHQRTGGDSTISSAAASVAPEGRGTAAAPAASSPDSGDAQWTIPAKNYASTRFSGLNEITAVNVGHLGLAWTFSTGVNRGQEAPPLIVGPTMYVVTPFPNILYALDLPQPGAPLKWKYEPHPLAAAQGVACCDVVNRGAVYYQGKIIYNLLDAHTVAVDAKTGKEVWRTKVGEINRGESVTMAPLVVKDKVLVGNSGGEFGGRGGLTALDAGTGKLAWRGETPRPPSEGPVGPPVQPLLSPPPRQELRGQN